MSKENVKSIETRIVHLTAHDVDTGAIVPPLYLSTTFQQKEPGVATGGYEYSRSDNPTRNLLEQSVSAIEGSEETLGGDTRIYFHIGVAFSSGSAALLAVILSLNANNKIVAGTDLYGGTHRFLQKIANEKLNIDTLYIDVDKHIDTKEIENFSPSLIWIESPSNPGLKVADIGFFAELAHTVNGVLVVDNTFMTPYLQNPLKLGADVVVHSATKALNGHCDALLGIALTNSRVMHEKIKFMQNALGAVPSPIDCFLVLRGMKTLCVRMKRQSESAKFITCKLRQEAVEGIEEILYPDEHLKGARQELITRQHHMNLHGSMFSVVFNFFSKPQLFGFISNMAIFTLAESLGGVESLVQVPSLMSHSQMTAQQRTRASISPFLVRFSVGLENAQELFEDIQVALQFALKFAPKFGTKNY